MAPNEIQFHYKGRTRPEQNFIGGISFRRTKLLDYVTIRTNGTLYRTYTLTHEASATLDYDRLTKVTESNAAGQSRPEINFTYDDTNHTFTQQDHLIPLSSEVSVETDQMASGDFDGDGRMDLVTFKKNQTGSVNAFTRIGTNSTAMNSFEAYGSDPERTATFASTILTANSNLASWQALTTVTETRNTNTYASTVKFRQARFFINTFNQEYTKEWNPTAYVYQNYCNDGTRRAVPKEYVPGDFNGDGLTDVIAINKSYSTRYCNTVNTGGGGGGPQRILQDQDNESSNIPIQDTNTKGGGSSYCSCSTNTVNNGQVNFIDLDRRKTSNFSKTAGYLNSTQPWAFGDKFYAIDFNGDGKTELLHLKENTVILYTLDTSNNLQLLYQHNDAYLKRNEAVLFGDFNGDGKTDLSVPTTAGSTVWRFFLSSGQDFIVYNKDIAVDYRRNGVFSSSFNGASTMQQAIWEYHFLAQDFNGDGKTDILKHTIITSQENENLSKEYISLYTNTHQNTHSYPGFNRTINHFTENTGVQKFGIPVFLETIKNNGNLEYAFIDKNRIWSYTFEKDHRKEVLLQQIATNGITQNIEYQNLGIKENSALEATYKATTEQVYPYVTLQIAPSFSVVKKVTETGAGHERDQLFKYRDGVTHLEGFGFLGFTLVSNTNIHGTNVPVLWNTVQTDPQLRGAVTHKWSASSFSLQPPDGNIVTDFISRNEYAYITTITGDNVFINLPLQHIAHDGLSNTLKTENYTYDSYQNITRLQTSYASGSNETIYTYQHNPSPFDENYYIGRVTQKVEQVILAGNTMTATETFTYTNNLISQRKYKGHQTDWIQEDYGYDAFGNMIQKTVSATGINRSEAYTYDTSGRFLTETTNVEGLSTQMNYDALGNLIQTTDPYGNNASFQYDGWNRLITETNYLGQPTTILYQGTPTGGLKITTSTPDGGNTIETNNAFGWTLETSTVSLNNTRINQQFEYDLQGKVTAQSEPYFDSGAPSQWNQNTYDLYGRVITHQTFTGKIINTTYSEKTVTVDDGTKITSTTVDDLGNIVNATDPGGTITYTHHPNNQLKTASYNGNVVSILIDGWGRKTQLNDPSAGIYTYQYNALGELIQETTPTGTTDYTLDANGKTLQKQIIGNETHMTIDYTYDGTTQQLTAISGTDAHFGKNYQYFYTYDSYQRPISTQENNDTAIFITNITYDALGRAETNEYRTTYKGNNTSSNLKIQNVYSPEGILTELQDFGSGTSLWQLTDQNHRRQPLEIQLGNGYKKTNTYDAYGLPTEIKDYIPNTANVALHTNYTFNAQRGILNSRSNHNFNWNENFSYDNQDRITQIGGSVNQTQQYDAMGRFTQKSNVGTYGYDTAKKYRITELDLNIEGDAWFQNHALQQVTYNAFKTPVEVVEQGHGRVSFEYHPMQGRSHAYYGGTQTDKLQRRYQKHYSSVSPVEITVDTQTNTTKFTTFIGGDAYTAPIMHIRQTGTGAFNAYHYLHRDYLGSILAITDSSGTLREQRQFGAWGTVDQFITHTNNTQFGYESSLINRGFTGHEHFFGVNLIHMNGRMYDTILGRFLSPDNYVQDPYNTQSFNRYGYVWNNPLIYSDPSGEIIWMAVAAGALIGGISASLQSGANFGSIFTGALIGGIAGGVGAGFSNIALGGSFFGNGVMSATGFAAGFTAGAISGLAGGFVSSSLTAWVQGSSFLDGLRSGIYGAAIASISGGILGGVSAGLRAKREGLGFFYNSRLGSKLSVADSELLRRRMEASIIQKNKYKKGVVYAEGTYDDWRYKRTVTIRITRKVFDARTTFYENALTFSRFAQKAGDGMSYTGYALTLSVVGAELGIPLSTAGTYTSFGGSLTESVLTHNYTNAGKITTVRAVDLTTDLLMKRIKHITPLGRIILTQNKSLKLSLIEKAITE